MVDFDNVYINVLLKFISFHCCPCLLALTIREQITSFCSKQLKEVDNLFNLPNTRDITLVLVSYLLVRFMTLPHRILGDVESGDRKRLLSCRTAVSAVHFYH